ncbi:MAG: aldehyde dehydrogenase family protein [Anaerolineaceae bacterium]|nr:aldehyde dehydrogenase family protein [Anaerolineaceae bacterium]
MDKDLLSIQEARELANQAYEAWKIWSKASQEEVDRVCAAMADAAFQASDRLGRLAHEETGFGVPAHKRLKNEFGSRMVWESIKDIKTVGVINQDTAKRIYEIAWPIGVVAALIPSTNPTSTVFFKTLIAVKARDAIVHAPHPFAVKCCSEAAQVMALAAERAGAPKGLISCLQTISLQGTQELMNHKRIALILATGGTPMVRAAHSVGKPAYGVGPGNVPVYVDRSADIEKAARYIVASKAFDCSTICATEQCVLPDRPIAARLKELMIAEGAHFCDESQTNMVRKALFLADGSLNTAVVGKPAPYVASYAGFNVSPDARILVTPIAHVGKEELLAHEKLTTVLAWHEVGNWEEGCEASITMIEFGGRGHSQIIYANDEKVIMAYGLEKPAFRIVVNTMGSLGAIGLTTGVMPSLTLGPGGVGGAITGDNITVYHMFNVKRLAYELRTPPAAAMVPGETPANSALGPDAMEIERIVREIVTEILSPKR